ncbi:hypothetical protein F2Q70_00012681 [Brassica cretica]|uniref:Uncharacterized protein n=2 Tax=Brassica cretica TaxID=69181 RepID=A0A8S9LYD7_BRACR|nr:hypothetical protein F2Q70_00012681 [Brassica cretica]
MLCLHPIHIFSLSLSSVLEVKRSLPTICYNASPLPAIQFSSRSSSLLIVFAVIGFGGWVFRYSFGGGSNTANFSNFTNSILIRSLTVPAVPVERSLPPICSNVSPLHTIQFSSRSSSLLIMFAVKGSAVGFCVTVSVAGSNTADLFNFTNSILLRSLTVPFGMDELGLPSRLFETGFDVKWI